MTIRAKKCISKGIFLKKLIICIYFRNNILLETGLMEREHRKWYSKKPECVAGKRITEESLVSVRVEDIASVLIFLFIGFTVSYTILILEIIVFRYNRY